jgi:hypothetical protein
MTELKATELVDTNDNEETTTEERKITLKEEFNWFLTPEFSSLKENPSLLVVYLTL